VHFDILKPHSVMQRNFLIRTMLHKHTSLTKPVISHADLVLVRKKNEITAAFNVEAEQRHFKKRFKVKGFLIAEQQEGLR